VSDRTPVRYLMLSDLTDDVGDMDELALRLDCWLDKVRRLAHGGFALAEEPHDPHAIALVGQDQSLADEEGLAEDVMESRPDLGGQRATPDNADGICADDPAFLDPLARLGVESELLGSGKLRAEVEGRDRWNPQEGF